VVEQHTPFDEFWNVCPRKTGKGTARRAFTKAVNAGVDPATLIDAMTNHANYWHVTGQDQQFIPHPTTWLNGERWDDELEPLRKRSVYEDTQNILAAARTRRTHRQQKELGQ
jgi:hypothetical protein